VALRAVLRASCVRLQQSSRHMARVQESWDGDCDFTRADSSGVLSTNRIFGFTTPAYSRDRSQRTALDHEFASTWQATLGRGIVDAIQTIDGRPAQYRNGWACYSACGASQQDRRKSGLRNKSNWRASWWPPFARSTADRVNPATAIKSSPEATAVASMSGVLA